MDGGEERVVDAEGLVEDPEHGSDRIRGVRSERHDVGVGGEDLVVDAAQQERDLARCLRCRGDDHLLGAGLQMLLAPLPGAVGAGGLDDDVDPEVGPVRVSRLLGGEEWDASPVEEEGVVDELDL